jgi:hypothetical protein
MSSKSLLAIISSTEALLLEPQELRRIVAINKVYMVFIVFVLG